MTLRTILARGGLAVLVTACGSQPQEDLTTTSALEKIRAGARRGDPEAQFQLGRRYFLGEGVPKDYAEAVKWYRRAAEQNLAEAQFQLGRCYLLGKGVPKDAPEAVNWYRKAATQNYAEAQYHLGVCYAEGEGVPEDDVEAVKWYRRAAEQNFAEAQFEMGLSYENGEGVPKDEVEAVKWYRAAAERNYARAQARLGLGYLAGDGVPKDATKAVQWFRKAADQNLSCSQYALGLCYARGVGVSKDATEAVKWYRKAADQDFDEAEFELGVCYAKGEGVPKDDIEAAKWYRKAAEQNHAKAQYSLGVRYAQGRGVVKDEVEAYKWVLLAAAQGFEPSKELVSSLERRLSRDEIREGQARARAFKPRSVLEFETSSQPRSPAELQAAASGTGFFITEDGYLVTAAHVVWGATQVRVSTNAGVVVARIVRVDGANDLALLKAEGRFLPLPLTSSRTVKLGATVATVGFPNVELQGFAPKMAQGQISALSGPDDDPRLFQISVPVQPGNSGAALFDECGNVVGVVTSKLNPLVALQATGTLPENVNYAVKSSFVLGFLEALPELAAKLPEPRNKSLKFEEAVARAREAAALVLVY
jgi:hypothetical protein